jgi:DNA gyrase subunit A
VELPDNTPVPEDAVVVFTQGGYLKRIWPAQLKRTPLPAPEESFEESARFFLPCTTAETLYIFTDHGNCYPVGVGKLAESKPRDRGQQLAGVLAGLEDGEQALFMLTADSAKLKAMPDFLFVTKHGMIKRTAAADYDVRSRKYPALSLKKDDGLLDVRPAAGDSDLLLITRGGMSIRFPLSGVPAQGRTASGVRAMSVDAGDEVCSFSQLTSGDEVILFSERGWAKRLPQSQFEIQNRAGKGVHCFPFNKNGSNGRMLAGVLPVQAGSPSDILVMQAKSPCTRMATDEVLLQNRQGKGMPYIMAILDDIITEIIGVDDTKEEA